MNPKANEFVPSWLPAARPAAPPAAPVVEEKTWEDGVNAATQAPEGASAVADGKAWDDDVAAAADTVVAVKAATFNGTVSELAASAADSAKAAAPRLSIMGEVAPWRPSRLSTIAAVAFDDKKPLNVVLLGHVDAGKSTISGHILYLTGNVDERTMQKYEKEAKELNRESWKFAFCLDTSEQERAKGKTEECGQASFTTETRRFTILDAPGHKTTFRI